MSDSQPVAVEPITARRGLVLIVDDQKATRDLFKLAMRGAGIPADACASAAEARNRIAGGDIKLVLVDLIMPDEGGRSLVDWVAVKYPKIKIVFITGDAAAADEDLRYDTILKPVTPARLAEITRWHLDRVEGIAMMEQVLTKIQELHDSLTPSGIVSRFVNDRALMMMVAAASALAGAYAKKMGWL